VICGVGTSVWKMTETSQNRLALYLPSISPLIIPSHSYIGKFSVKLSSRI
jgi:hypothetical protein